MSRALACCLALVLASAGGIVWWGRMLAPVDAATRLTRESSLRVGYAIEAPYAFVGPQGLDGESVAVVNAMASRLGIRRVDWVVTDFHELIPQLLAGRFDVIAAGLFTTSERAQRVDFSQPTAYVGAGLLLRVDESRQYATLAEVAADTHFVLAVVRDAVEETRARMAGVPLERLLRVPDAASGFEAVRSGRADGLALSAPTLRAGVRAPGHDDLRVVMLSGEPMARRDRPALAFRKQDQSLRQICERALATYLGSDEHLVRVMPLGFTADELRPQAGER